MGRDKGKFNHVTSFQETSGNNIGGIISVGMCARVHICVHACVCGGACMRVHMNICLCVHVCVHKCTCVWYICE